MTIKQQALNHIKDHPGLSTTEIGVALGCGEIVARSVLFALKNEGKAYDVRGVSGWVWHAAGYGGYSGGAA